MKYYAKIETENYRYDEWFEADSNDEAVDMCYDLQRKVKDETEESARCDLCVWINTDGRKTLYWEHIHTTDAKLA